GGRSAGGHLAGPVGHSRTRGAYPPSTRLSAVGVDSFFLLLRFLALDAQRRFGAGFEPLERDRLFALLADPVGSFVHLAQRNLDLAHQVALAPTQAEGESLHVLTGGLVDLVEAI